MADTPYNVLHSFDMDCLSHHSHALCFTALPGLLGMDQLQLYNSNCFNLFSLCRQSIAAEHLFRFFVQYTEVY